MLNYTYQQFEQDIHALTEQIAAYRPDTIIAVARGGMMLGQMLAYGLDVRNVQTIHIESYDHTEHRNTVSIFGSCDFSRSKRVLIVDDIVDSGKTLAALMEHFRDQTESIQMKTAAIFYKPRAVFIPDFKLHEATEWIDFFWERHAAD